MSNTGIVILAAGNSSRMGQPKQLMKYKNKTFLQHIIDESKRAELDPVICVTGYEAEKIAKTINGTDITLVYNEKWREGMGTGISAGLKELIFSDFDSVILAVSDQPHVSAELFESMRVLMDQSGKGIVASSYSGTLGTPVLFAKKYFDQLESLSGDQGAKSIVKMHMADVCTIEFEKGGIDIDTKEDYDRLISEIKS